VLLVLVGGVIADRLPRQAVMMVADTIRGLAHGALALLIATGTVRIWHMVVIGLLFGTSEAFFQPAYTGLVPQTVAEDDIQAAQALGGLSREFASFVSPALATALVLGAGGAVAFGLDAATFAVSAATLWRVRTRRRGAVVVRTRAVRAAGRLGGGPGTLLGLGHDRRLLGVPAARAGAVLRARPLGVPARVRHRGGFRAHQRGVGHRHHRRGGGRRPLAAASPDARRDARRGGLAGPDRPLRSRPTARPAALLYPVTAAAGIGLGLFGVWWETALAQRIPGHLLSRVSAWDWMGSLALLPAGYLLAGPVANALGDVRVLFCGGVAGLVAIALGLLPRSTRALTRLQAGAADQVPITSDRASAGTSAGTPAGVTANRNA
jgi:hypothetical protein